MAIANVVISSNMVVQCSTPTRGLVERRIATFRLKHLIWANKIGCAKGKKCRAAVICASATETTSINSTNAKDAVNLGLSLFNQGRIKDAIIQFEKALSLDPSPDEARAALYNKACCHASREEGGKTAEALRMALRDYNLNFSVILNDPDMAAFRAMPEFRELQNEARLGGDDIGGSFRRDLKLISEVQAPFRAVRKFFYAALCVAAGISTFFTIPRLFRSIQGGDGAPELWETVGNTAINIGGIIILVALIIWENRKEEEQIAQISRNETLSRLPLRLSTNRVIELVQLRDTARPVILAGTKDAVNRAVQRAEKFRIELIERGVLIVPLVWRNERENPIRKKGFGGRRKLATANSSSAGEFGKRAKDIVTKTIVEVEKRFKAEIVSPSAWERVCRIGGR
ncbi:protein LOW PSII ACCUMULATION 1, chloroplastic isoform X2 [Cryptomeria japonica]|uniref:protein LOW PSII ACCUMULATION 1, chloroplastic isoform X2 n=1 Tax=Cryptomeria japonica TaxID=3369 RepID=UPI0027DAA885|nr:protein LOW PSII ACCUMULATION 1, chloroplastic isoform X2 [Cryptomeria japonica]